MVVFKNRSFANKKDVPLLMGLAVVAIIVLNFAVSLVSLRLDLTNEKKYSLLSPTKKLVRELKDEILIKVYLEGEMSSDFKQLRQATKDVLTEFRAVGGKKIKYEFIDPIKDRTKEERDAMLEDFLSKGLSPVNEQTGKANESKVTTVFPFATAYYGGREFPIQLIQSQIGYDKKQTINNSIISLEYNFANAIQKLTQYRPPRVAFTAGHGELNALELADIQNQLVRLNYEVQMMDLSAQFQIPDKFDAIIVAKPLVAFDEKDKYKIDQFVMKGGKVLWLIDATNASMDSLKSNPTGQFVVDRSLNLDDLLFKYGARVNNDIIQDINLCNPIPLVVGKMGNAPQTELFPWYYFPLLISDNNHPIVKNLDPVAATFVSTIDTIQNKNVSKTILLHTSDNSKAILTPARVHFGILQNKPNPQYFTQARLPVAVLLEGKFQSLYKNRLSSSFLAAGDSMPELRFLDESKDNRMIVIADGDIIKNIVRPDSSAYPLGFYPYTNQTFANKDFVLNCIQYLVDNEGLLATRNKEVKLRLLNTIRANDEKLKWQLVNVLFPILLIIGFGLGYRHWRRKRYATPAPPKQTTG